MGAYIQIHMFHIKIFFFFKMECCWRTDSKERPSFREILKTLDDIAHSKFHQMPDDNFYTLQADWKVEIDEKIIEIREKEKVKSLGLVLIFVVSSFILTFLKGG